jgi:2,4-dienoyl-CoA reductase-like NADH-dependent reductase (Old Yellow Enzyme family)
MNPCEPLFRPFAIGSLSLRNRVVMAPMTRRKAPADGVPDERIAAYYARRAAGGVGLIVTEGTHVDGVHAPDTANVPGIWNEAQREGWGRVVDAVHAAESPLGGRAAIALQLGHTGRHGADPIAPSPVPVPDRKGGVGATPREMTARDMDQVAEAFAGAAERARRAGFDAVEIHGAHGYLLHSFLSARDNLRDDAFGGSLEDRMRFPLRVVRAVRAAAGSGYPVIYRFSQFDEQDLRAACFPDAASLGVWLAALREAGVDALHASTARATAAAFEGSPRTLAGWARQLSGLPAIAVGRVGLSAPGPDGGRSVEDPAPAARLIEEGEADLVAVGRALIANPDFCALVAAGRWRELRAYSPLLVNELV